MHKWSKLTEFSGLLNHKRHGMLSKLLGGVIGGNEVTYADISFWKCMKFSKLNKNFKN